MGGCDVATLSSSHFFLKRPWWPIRKHTHTLSQLFSLLSPLIISRILPRPFDCLARGGRLAIGRPALEFLVGDNRRSRRYGRRKSSMQPRFLVVSGAVRPPFTVRPPILERALRPLQNRAPLTNKSLLFKNQLLITPCFSRLFW